MVLIKPLNVNMVISLQLIHELIDCLQFSLELVPLRLSESTIVFMFTLNSHTLTLTPFPLL